MNSSPRRPGSRWCSLTVAGALMLGALATTPVHGVTVGQVDTFEDGTTQNWSVALGPLQAVHPVPPVNVLGGPGGVDDNFLRISSVGGNVPGGRLTVMNFQSQWSGDYIAAGIASIGMNVINFGAADLYLRLLFEDPLTGAPENIAYSAAPILVLAGSGWNAIEFPIGVADLEAGLGNATAALTNATTLRIYHSTGTPNKLAQPIVAQLGIDNIRALGRPVPEGTATGFLLAGAFAALSWLRVRRQS